MTSVRRLAVAVALCALNAACGDDKKTIIQGGGSELGPSETSAPQDPNGTYSGAMTVVRDIPNSNQFIGMTAVTTITFQVVGSGYTLTGPSPFVSCSGPWDGRALGPGTGRGPMAGRFNVGVGCQGTVQGTVLAFDYHVGTAPNELPGPTVPHTEYRFMGSK